MELEAQRENKETRGRRRRNQGTKEVHDMGHGKGTFFIWGGTVSSWGTGPKCRTVRKGCSSHLECTPGLLRHLWPEKRAATQTSLDRFFKRVDNWIQPRTRNCAIVRREWNCSFLSISYCWQSFRSIISPLYSLLQSVTLLACSLDAGPCASCCTVLLYFSMYCKITFFLIFVVF